MTMAERFWERLDLAELDHDQWESLCDRCGICCLHKLQDVDTDEIHQTNVACRLLNLRSCRCGDYANRRAHVPECLSLTAETVRLHPWLPSTCAYRRLAEGKPLPAWHPLISGDPNGAQGAGVAVRGRVVSEDCVREPTDHLVEPWWDGDRG